jgi:hypothetical protein
VDVSDGLDHVPPIVLPVNLQGCFVFPIPFEGLFVTPTVISISNSLSGALHPSLVQKKVIANVIEWIFFFEIGA